MSSTIARTWKENLPAAVLMGVFLIGALFLPLAHPYTGPLRLPPPRDEYGGPHFPSGPLEYPREVMDSEGYAVKLVRPARKVASQYWSIDEYLYSIVPPERVAAVSQAAYDRSFSNVYQWAEQYRPVIATDPEVILKVNPDLLLVSGSARADFTNLLRAAGKPIFRMFTAIESLDQVERTIRLVGYLSGEDASAERVANDFRRAVSRARSRRTPGDAAPRILGYAGKYSFGDHTLFDDVVRALGGINVGAANGIHGYKPVSSEQIVRWNPEWIVAGAGRGQSESVLRRLLDDQAVSNTAAARRGQVLVLENNVFLAISPFTVLMLDALGEALYE